MAMVSPTLRNCQVDAYVEVRVKTLTRRMSGLVAASFDHTVV